MIHVDIQTRYRCKTDRKLSRVPVIVMKAFYHGIECDEAGRRQDSGRAPAPAKHLPDANSLRYDPF